MSIPHGLETLHFSFTGTQPAGRFAPVLVGVVGSGNLEVLIEPLADGTRTSDSTSAGGECRLEVSTSARGFAPIWRAVAEDFHARHPLGGVLISINDMGATPAVVNLRLDQAVAQMRSAQP
ncbi:malonate decarboxylase acyl carrier protein [Curvibacter gracilis]|uniref:malonate decarboxylase acyl carrier protein n=1 Tax=Curvibacter gracilis TaxID=230310 RepID=UPI0004851544|nr:malonate decarboxylase acyl carrier protein [Curvibacter gracilis]